MEYVKMKWFVIVFFLSYDAEGARDTFVFSNPVYTNEAQCRATLVNREEIMKYVHGMMMAYNGMLPGAVEKVNCINENQYNMLRNLKEMQDGKHDT
jgi:hypothetical protein